MSNLPELVVPAISVQISGKEYKISVLRLKDHALAADKMSESWSNPGLLVRQLGKNLSDASQRILLETAYKDARRSVKPTLAEVFLWYQTPEGALFKMWLSFQAHHPELTIDDVDLLLIQEGITAETLANLSAKVEGLPSGNSQGGARTPPQNNRKPSLPTGHGAVSS